LTNIVLEEASIAHLIFRTNSQDKKSLWRTSDRNAFIKQLTQEITRKEEISGDMSVASIANAALPSPWNAQKTNTATIEDLIGKKLRSAYMIALALPTETTG